MAKEANESKSGETSKNACVSDRIPVEFSKRLPVKTPGKCPFCEEEKKTSRLHVGASCSTLAGYEPYYDENGKFHNHDGNRVTQTTSCSNGHSFEMSGCMKCASCDYGTNSWFATMRSSVQTTVNPSVAKESQQTDGKAKPVGEVGPVGSKGPTGPME